MPSVLFGMLTSCSYIASHRLRLQCERSAKTVIHDPVLWSEYVRIVTNIPPRRPDSTRRERFGIFLIVRGYDLINEQAFRGNMINGIRQRPKQYEILRNNIRVMHSDKLVAVFGNYFILYPTIEKIELESCVTLNPTLYLQRQRNV